MFSTEHFIWIGICIVFIVSLSIISIKKNMNFHKASIIMALIALVSEISKIMSDMTFVNGEDCLDGMVLTPGSLPLHLCSMLIFAYFYLPFAKNDKLKKYLLGIIVPIGLIGGALAILIATNGTGFDNIAPYQCFIYHAGMIWYSIYLIGTKKVELGKKVWLTNLGTLFSMSFVMLWVNAALKEYDTNFWFVVRPPRSGLPILNLDNGWYVYFLTLLCLGFIGITLVHLPFVIKEFKNKNN